MGKKVLVGLLLVLVQQLHFNTAIEITITPTKAVADEEIDVELKCRLNGKENGLKEVDVFKVNRKGDKTIVSLYGNNTIKFMGSEEDEYKVTGKIDGEKSVLDLTILKADVEDSGSYNCVIQYKDGTGKSVEHKANAKLKVDDPQVKNLNNTMVELLKKVAEEEDAIKKLEEKEKEEEKKVSDLEEKNQEQINKLKGLGDKEKEIEKKVEEIEEKADKELKEVTDKANKAETELGNLNGTLATLTEKLNKKAAEIDDIDKKEKEDHKKVKDLEEKSQKQEKAITELDEREAKLEQKVNKVGNEITDQLKKFSDMTHLESRDKSFIVSLEAKEKDAETKLQATQQERTEIAEKIRQLELKVETATQTLKGYTSDNSGTQSKTSTGSGTSVSSSTMDGTGQDTPMIAFTATNQNDVAKPHENSVFIFPDVMTQWGSGYDPMTGVFTAPNKGLYLITLLIKVDCNACYVMFQVMANSKVLFKLRVGHKYDKPQVSASTPVDLQQGDQVKIMTEDSSFDTVVSISRYSMFSAYLINAS